MSSPATRTVRRKAGTSYPLNDVTNDVSATPRQSSHHFSTTTDGSPSDSERRRRTPSSTATPESPATPSTIPQTRAAQAYSTPRHTYHQTNNVPHSAQYLLPDVDPAAAPRLTVVLDLDETLVCNRKAYLTHAVLRPYAKEFLRVLSRADMEVVVWTASTDDTALPVLRQLDPEGVYIEHCVFRNAHWYTEPHHTKDLRLLGRPLSRVVLVDNAPNCCKLQPHNAVLVEDFTGVEDPRDTTLVGIYRILELLAAGVTRRNESVPSMLQRVADNDEILQHVTVLPPQSAIAKALSDGHGAYTHSTMLSSPPQGAYFRVKRVQMPSGSSTGTVH